MDDILSRLVARPPSGGDEPRYRTGRERRWVHGNRPNYLLREARNSSLGSAGERFVLNFEQARLIKEGKERLAAQVEQVSQTRGDHEGFDILSFESDGRERLIEVKTTAFGSLTPFFVSQNQVKTSHQHRDQFQVYRVFRFRRDPRLFAVPGAIGENCDLEAREFVARWL